VAAQPLPLHEHKPTSDGWPSYWYYLWSSSKAYSFIEDSGATPIPPTNLTPAKIGILPPGDAPAFADREVHLDCAAIPRVPLFGAGGNGYYCDPAEPNGFTSTTLTRS
jgi:hypothetical protein